MKRAVLLVVLLSVSAGSAAAEMQPGLDQAIRNNWDVRKKVHTEGWGECSHTADDIKSACTIGGNTFETFELVPSNPLCSGCIQTTALYCPRDLKYWIQESGGDPYFRCRTLGPFPLSGGISCFEAVKLAEIFVKEQGYTDEPAAVTGDKIAHEFMEEAEDPEELLALRRGMLPAGSFGAYDQGAFWIAVFAHAGSAQGRGVRVRKDDASVELVHQGVIVPDVKYACIGQEVS